ncbi:GTPase-activating protein [Mycoemilia scoparia]|uniref:GTPase-activating protein n=1 Tax=Mycoemilia scoparia TaxID=417184 RepID=A0A9W8DVX8_9FUNG|nr:GTPase-activating protein [Mycoemilia scoparia]
MTQPETQVGQDIGSNESLSNRSLRSSQPWGAKKTNRPKVLSPNFHEKRSKFEGTRSFKPKTSLISPTSPLELNLESEQKSVTDISNDNDKSYNGNESIDEEQKSRHDSPIETNQTFKFEEAAPASNDEDGEEYPSENPSSMANYKVDLDDNEATEDNKVESPATKPDAVSHSSAVEDNIEPEVEEEEEEEKDVNSSGTNRESPEHDIQTPPTKSNDPETASDATMDAGDVDASNSDGVVGSRTADSGGTVSQKKINRRSILLSSLSTSFPQQTEGSSHTVVHANGDESSGKSDAPANPLSPSGQTNVTTAIPFGGASQGQITLVRRGTRSQNPRRTSPQGSTHEFGLINSVHNANQNGSSIGGESSNGMSIVMKKRTDSAQDGSFDPSANSTVTSASQESPVEPSKPNIDNGATKAASQELLINAPKKPSMSSDIASVTSPNLDSHHLRSPSVTSHGSNKSMRSAGPNRPGFFASVTSFFNRTSITNGGTSPENHEDPLGPESLAEDMLLSQLEAQNSLLVKNPKACMFPAQIFKQELDIAHNEAIGEGTDGEIDWNFWYKLGEDFDQTVRRESRMLVQKVNQGIPQRIRSSVWHLLCRTGCSPELDETFQANQQKTSPFEKIITQDVKRTLQSVKYFEDPNGPGQQALFRVLKAYSLYDKEVGYCQGLSFVVAPLLVNMNDVQAFRILVKLMDNFNLRGHFTPDMPDLRVRTFQFERLFSESLPLLFNHFRSQGVNSTMYASQWFMTLFASRLPIEMIVRLYDVIFAEGIDALLRFALVLLKRSQSHLIGQQFDDIVKFLNGPLLYEYYVNQDPGVLIEDAGQITCANVRRLRRLAEEFKRINDTGSSSEEYLDTLTNKNHNLEQENSHLLKKLQDLSLEHSDLTTQLVQVQKEREEYENLVNELRKQLLIERQEAEKALKGDMDALAKKNMELVNSNQKIQEYSQDIEGDLIRFKTMYAQSENDREILTKKLDSLRKALS